MEKICKCGSRFNINENQLKRGRGKFCSKQCYYKARSQYSGINSPKYKHGLRQTRFYRIWTIMKRRCNNPNDSEYFRYGDRGIKVLWKDFLKFRDDMHKSYLNHVQTFGEKNTTIDRIDNYKGYFLENCRWATKSQQMKNCTYAQRKHFKIGFFFKCFLNLCFNQIYICFECIFIFK